MKKEKKIKKITVVIPNRKSQTPETTLKSLPDDVEVIVVNDDDCKGANWARNEGYKRVETEYVLFSDNDINWHPGAFKSLLQTLEEHPECSYSYGAYRMGDDLYCWEPFDPEQLKDHNYISTMSLIRAKDFPGFDENIKRFQDWDLWLTMLEQGKIGINCGEEIFDTKIREGITFGGSDPFEMAEIVKKKHL